MELQFEISEEDWVEFNKIHARRSSQLKSFIIIGILALIFLCVLFTLGSSPIAQLAERLIFPIAFIFFFVIFIYLSRTSAAAFRSLLKGSKNRALIGPHRIGTYDAGIWSESQVSRAEYQWAAFEKIVDAERLLLLYIGSNQAILVPKRAFASEQQLAEFKSLLLENSEISDDTPTSPPQESSSVKIRQVSIYIIIFLLTFSGYYLLKNTTSCPIMPRQESEFTLPPTFGPDSGLKIVNHNMRRTNSEIAILGQIVNKGENAWDGVSVEIDVFDKDGTFIDQCRGYLQGRTEPGAERNFKATCTTDQELGKAYADYKATIVSAYPST